MSRGWFRWPRPGGAEPTGRGAAPPGPEATPETPGKRRRRYSTEQKREIVAAYHQSGKPPDDFCAEQGLSCHSLARWVTAERKAAGSSDKPKAPADGRVGERIFDSHGVEHPSRRRAGTTRRTTTKKRRRRRRAYTPEERRQAIEAFQASSLRIDDFCRTWGVSTGSLATWLRRYRDEGPRGLEPRKRKPSARDEQRRLAAPVKSAIVETKEKHPDFGVRKVRDTLLRFSGIRVSLGSIVKTLREAEIPLLSKGRRKPRRRDKPPRRFERARPSELWQSDITSYVLAREGRRVSLVVFLDDNSRYIVSWGLHLHQKQDIVIEALLAGIAAFGKPREVLTDQGRQYYAWRGKSQFQKLLDKEGIQHVVSRAHHPQTLGKAERLWKTIGCEFWQRAKPQDLQDARERLAHFVMHYNHFRPHQGIGGLVPADRFFGAESTVRRSLEQRMSEHELRLALDAPPRRPVYLFGQVGDEKVSLHGEKGRLVIQTHDGRRQVLGLDELGVEARGGDDGRASNDAGYRDGHGGEQDRDGGGGDSAPAAPGQEEDEVPGAQEVSSPGEGPLATGERGGEEESTRDLHGDPRALARQGEQEGGGKDSVAATAAGLAALPAGAFGYAGRASGPTTGAREAERDAQSRTSRRAIRRCCARRSGSSRRSCGWRRS